MLNQGVITLTAPFLNFGVSLALNPETALAAFGAAFSLTIIFNSLVFTSLKLYNSLLKDKNSFVTILGIYMSIACAASLIFIGLAATEAGHLVFTRWFNLSPGAAGHSREWMLWVSPVPLLVAFRCALQGVTTVYRKTMNTAVGTFLRMGTALVAVIVLIRIFPHRPGMASGAAFSLAILVEVVYLFWRTRKMLAFSRPTSVAPYDFDLSVPYVLRYSFPLWLSSLAWTGSFPLVNFFIAQTQNPEAGLAGFSILRAVNVCLNSPLPSMVTVVVILGNRATISRLKIMGTGIALVLTLISAGLVFTPMGRDLLSDIFNLRGVALEWSAQALIFFIFTPALFLARFFLEGRFMRLKQTRAMGLAGIMRLFIMAGAGLMITSWQSGINGVWLGMTLMTLASVSDAGITALAFYLGPGQRSRTRAQDPVAETKDREEQAIDG